MNILIVDDDVLAANALKIILESDPSLHVIGTGTDGTDAVRLFSELKPDVLLMDIRMKHMNGLDASIQILKDFPKANILLLTTFSDDEYIVRALHMGAKGYILKQNFESIAPALMAVQNNQTVFGDEITDKLPDLMRAAPERQDFREYDITDREMEIIRQVAEGLNNKEIAEKLFLSEGTVRNYLSIILDKLGLRDRTQLAIFYYRQL